MKKTSTLALVSLALITPTGIGFAAEAPEDKWQFGVTLPIWAAGINGDVTVAGVTSDLDVGFDDLMDHLDASFSIGLEARRNKFGLYGGVGYMKFTADGEGDRGGEGDVELTFIIADAGISYRLMKTEGERPFVLEGTAGVRYWHMDLDLELTGPTGRVLVDGDEQKDLLDPVIGLRASQYLNQKWHLDFQGDIGGFGVSDNSSDLTWSAAGLVSYDVARWLTLSGGYKALGVDSSDDDQGLDIVMHGLLLTAKFKF